MADKLDELLGIGRAESTPSIARFTVPHPHDHIVDAAAMKIQAGADFDAVLDDVYAQGVKKGKSEGGSVLKEFHELRSRYGDAFARAWLRDQSAAADKKLPRIEAERRQIRLKLAALKEQVTHGEAVRDAIAAGKFIFKTSPFIIGNSRCSCHEILEQINDDLRRPRLIEVGRDEPIDKTSLLRLHQFVLNAQKFDLRPLKSEDIEPNAAFSYELEHEGLLLPPFPECVFEWTVEPNLTIAALYTAGDHSFCSLVKVPKAGWAAWDHLPPDAPNRNNLLRDHVEQVCRAAIVVLNSACAERISITPDPKKNRQRERGGKLPLFEHTVVEIRGYQLNQKGVPTGRTHRSPRMHWRRGHLRRFRNQAGEVYRVTPIAPMLVGSAALGKIEHHYMVSARTKPTPQTGL